MTEPTPVSIPEKDPLLLDLDIPGSMSVPPVAPVPAPLPVIIAPEQAPIPVVVAASALPVPVTTTKGEGTTLLPTTTEQQDVVTQGQRHINRVWEYSQAAIALLITLAVVYCAVNRISSQDLTNAFFLIVGFYFSRVNHQAIGGVGAKPQEPPYTGR